ncbi:MAG: D-aminoacylase [Cytophagales bacterium]|nr:D-aminoacylase [Armatimonadota bacterium]
MLSPAPHLDDSAAHYDLLVRGGTVYDGCGTLPRVTDVAVQGGRIAAVGDLSQASATRTISAAGKFVCPGFIDIHTHSDLSLLYTPGMDSSLAQGVTTEVVGNCGFSLALARPDAMFAQEQRGLERGGITLDWSDLPGFLRRIEDSGIAINVATLAGHGTLRKRAMGFADRLPDAAELTTMRRDLTDALAAGAIGLSSGLEYVPGMYADIAEMTALAKVAAEAGGFYATHLRDEGDHLEAAVTEAIAVAEGAGVPLQLSHHKAEKPRNWGKVVKTLAMVDDAQKRGLDILLDQYPYTAYQTGLATIALPPWAVGGTPLEMARKLRDPDVRARARLGMGSVNYGVVEIASCAAHREYQGRTVQELAREAGADPRDWVLDLLTTTDGWISAAHFALSEEDVEYVMRDPRVMIGSDAVAISPIGPASVDRPHPRSYGTFARIFARYVREKSVLSYEEAIRRMTTLPAARIGLRDRGQVAPGFAADLVVFDPAAITDTATFAVPHALAVGIELVVVAGEVAFRDGIATGARAGRVLRRSSALPLL